MNASQRSADERSKAWEFIGDLGLDAACLQETFAPPSGQRATYAPARERTWGTAIVVWGEVELRPALIQEGVTVPGTAVTASLTRDGGVPITVVSMYGLIQKRANGVGYAVPSVHSALNDLTATLDVRRSGQPVVLAGDLNVSPQVPPPDTDAHAAVISRIKAFGLIDCLGSTQDGFVRTHRHRNNPNSKAYQDDWVFASPKLRLVSCEALDDGAAWALSDHCPVLFEFDVLA
jgi:exonuclease III